MTTTYLGVRAFAARAGLSRATVSTYLREATHPDKVARTVVPMPAPDVIITKDAGRYTRGWAPSTVDAWAADHSTALQARYQATPDTYMGIRQVADHVGMHTATIARYLREGTMADPDVEIIEGTKTIQGWTRQTVETWWERLVNSRPTGPARRTTPPPTYLTATGVARTLGISRDRLDQAVADGTAPAPDATLVGDPAGRTPTTPLWEQDRVRTWTPTAPQEPAPTVTYLSRTGFAHRAGLSPDTITSYRAKGLIPDPDATIAGSPHPVAAWLPQTVDYWAANRPGQGKRVARYRREKEEWDATHRG